MTNDLIAYVGNYADIDTRRMMGLQPRKLTKGLDLNVNFKKLKSSKSSTKLVLLIYGDSSVAHITIKHPTDEEIPYSVDVAKTKVTIDGTTRSSEFFFLE